MNKTYELDYTQLKKSCSPSDFTFQSTEELTPLEGIIGQERAVKAFEFGLAVKMKGYNIYMGGPSGTGKTSYAISSTQKLAITEPVPMDWCYVYNFENPMKPRAISFEAGIGRCFADDMAEFVAQIRKELSKAFQSEDYEREKFLIELNFENQQDALFDEMRTFAEEYDFVLKSMDTSICFIPLVNGEPVETEEFDELPEEEKAIIDKKNLLLREKTSPLMRKIQEIRRECDKQIEELDHKIGNSVIENYVDELIESYKTNERVVSYINNVKKDVLDNLEQFVEGGSSEEDVLSSLMPFLGKKQEEDITQRYRVNLIVDNSQTKGAPVVVNFNPTYGSLMGETEYDSEFGSLTTDFMKIKSGLFHQANGGYLIVQAHDILTAPHAWEALRTVIKTREINTDLVRERQGSAATPVLKPEPIPIEFKVIMIGSEYFYDVLSECDEEFDKFFKIRADFDYEMPRTDENITKITQFIKGFVERENTLEFDVSAICSIIEYSSRAASKQDKLSTRFNHLAEILVEAHTWAKLEHAAIITAQHVEKAVYEKEQRMKLYEEKLDEMLDDDVVMIDTEGAKIGQINGLAVLDMGNYAFGTPARITATTYVGKSGIVNIEKEAHMSGHTHDKGVQIILSGPVGPWNTIAMMCEKIVSMAHKYVYIQTPYFLPTDSLGYALQVAALSGVEVCIMMPVRTDWVVMKWGSFSYITQMLNAGVKIYLYQPGMLHAKTIVADDELVSIGSANFDFRSFEHNFETNALVYGEALALRVKEDFMSDVQHCVLVDCLEEWRARPFVQKVCESVVRLVSPIL